MQQPCNGFLKEVPEKKKEVAEIIQIYLQD